MLDGEDVTLKIVQAGDPVLRARARELSAQEIQSRAIQDLIDQMRETMREAPASVRRASNRRSLQLAVIEDRDDYQEAWPTSGLRFSREPVAFHASSTRASTPAKGSAGAHRGASAVGPRGRGAASPDVHVDTRQHGRRQHRHLMAGTRILQHEIDHLHGTLCVDRMYPRTLMTQDAYAVLGKPTDRRHLAGSTERLPEGRWLTRCA